MTIAPRILLVERDPTERGAALSGFSHCGLVDSTAVVEDRNAALDFLRADHASSAGGAALPAVVVLGPGLQFDAALGLVRSIRRDSQLSRLPVVMMSVAPDTQMLRSAFEEGANSVVRPRAPERDAADAYAKLARYWVWVNEPPPGCTAARARRPWL
jgi:two-component system response regulator